MLLSPAGPAFRSYYTGISREGRYALQSGLVTWACAIVPSVRFWVRVDLDERTDCVSLSHFLNRNSVTGVTSNRQPVRLSGTTLAPVYGRTPLNLYRLYRCITQRTIQTIHLLICPVSHCHSCHLPLYCDSVTSWFVSLYHTETDSAYFTNRRNFISKQAIYKLSARPQLFIPGKRTDGLFKFRRW